ALGVRLSEGCRRVHANVDGCRLAAERYEKTGSRLGGKRTSAVKTAGNQGRNPIGGCGQRVTERRVGISVCLGFEQKGIGSGLPFFNEGGKSVHDSLEHRFWIRRLPVLFPVVLLNGFPRLS